MNYKEHFTQLMESQATEVRRILLIESAINRTPFDGGKYKFNMSMYADGLIREVEDLEMREEITKDESFEIERMITELT